MGVFSKKTEEGVDPTQPLTEPKAPVTADTVPERADYNCVPCKGEGLVVDPASTTKTQILMRCPACQGTGKLS